MSHSADETFFHRKRAWSLKKDRVLSNYLRPYLYKVAKLNRPILLVDGFAGPGRFKDGNKGSPLILCDRAVEQVTRGRSVKVLCVEKDPKLYAELRENLLEYPFAQAHHGAFLDFVELIDAMAVSHTTFLYLDPYTIGGLDLAAILKVGDRIRSHGASVELLLNLNVASFGRRARAALKKPIPDTPETDEVDFGVAEPQSVENLNTIAGGTWWKQTLERNLDFPTEVKELMSGFESKLSHSFGRICYVPIFENSAHKVPKYNLLYGTRIADGLLLMNDEMVRAVRDGEMQTDFVTELELEEAILSAAEREASVLQVVETVIRQVFCIYKTGDVKSRIKKLIGEEKLKKLSPDVRLKDSTVIVREQHLLF